MRKCGSDLIKVTTENVESSLRLELRPQAEPYIASQVAGPLCLDSAHASTHATPVADEREPAVRPLTRMEDPSGESGEHWRWCPRCGHELHNEKCKLRCPRCHYFMSCSDFDS